MTISEEIIRSILSKLESNSPKWSIESIILKLPKVFITIEVERASSLDPIRELICSALESLISKENLQLIFTNKTSLEPGSKPKHYIEGVKKLFLVASGKGGVGKSTMSLVIAEKLQQKGYKVGIVDADIYGPSIPTMLGIFKRPEIIDKKIIPLVVRDMQVISIGFVTDPDGAIAWRGPMATKALYQLLSSVKWDDLDYLIVDMPPGTGDIHLSILENYHVDGVYIVTTPQLVAMSDVERAINLYKKFDVEIRGVIENMSYLADSSGNKIQIFAGNAGKGLSEKYNIPLLIQVPIVSEISRKADTALPIASLIPDFDL